MRRLVTGSPRRDPKIIAAVILILAAAISLYALAIYGLRQKAIDDERGAASGQINLPGEETPLQESEDLVGERYLQELSACSGLQLGGRDVLILEYRFTPPDGILILEEEGRDFIASAGGALLTVEVSRMGGGYRVLFRLTYKGVGLRPVEGEPPEEWERVELSIVRELPTVYDPGRGYSLLNGTLLGRLFPLFERGETLSIDYLCAKPGERYELERLQAVDARLVDITVWDLEKRVALALNGSRVVASMPFDEVHNRSYVEDTIRRTEKRRAISGCPNLLASANYASVLREAQLLVSIDYPTSIPTFILMEGAATYMPGGKYTRNGKPVEELPASLLAELLGIRSTTLALELEEIRVERSG